MEAKVVEKTILYGKNIYKVNDIGEWQVLLPHQFYTRITKDKVPEEVISKAVSSDSM